MKCYLTGSKGFIGWYLTDHLKAQGDEIVGTQDNEGVVYDVPSNTEIVYHLGALVRPQESMRWRRDYLNANVVATLDLLQSVKANAPDAKVVLFGSGTQFHHDSWYAFTKTMAELCGEAYAKFDGLAVYRLRFFGITGIGKRGDVVNDFAEQAARLGTIHHGDLSVARDISDVRDVIPAFDHTVRTLPPGTYYIGRGEATPVRHIAEWFGVPLQEDPSRVRVEAPVHVSPSKTVHGRPIEETLQWVYESWKQL